MYASLCIQATPSFSMSYTEKCVSVCKTETVGIGPVYEATIYIRLSIQQGYNELWYLNEAENVTVIVFCILLYYDGR